MSQSDQILKTLERGLAITPIGALRRFGCLRLAARIQDLRARGHNIITEEVKRKGKRFARYRLINKRS